jgi:3-oxoadipate enol-lactonase
MGMGDPVILIHGNFVSMRMWDTQLPLAKSFDLILYDVRGFGQSPLVGGRYSDEADLAALLNALSLDSAHLVGSSMGGSIALDFALRYPERVRSMVVVPGGISGWEPPDWMMEGWDEFKAALRTGDAERATDTVMGFPPMRPLEARPALHEAVAAMIRQHRWGEDWDSVETDELQPPAAQRLAEVSAPTLVLSGSLDDAAFRELGDRMAREMPNAERLVVEGGSHSVHMELPDEFNQAVTEFIRRIDRSRQAAVEG